MVPKTRPNPAKFDVLHEKKFRFLLKKTIQPRKKVKFCRKKWQKNDQKMDPKNHPTPQKTRSFAWKIENRPTLENFEKKNLNPQLHQIFKPISKFFCIFYDPLLLT